MSVDLEVTSRNIREFLARKNVSLEAVESKFSATDRHAKGSLQRQEFEVAARSLFGDLVSHYEIVAISLAYPAANGSGDVNYKGFVTQLGAGLSSRRKDIIGLGNLS